MKALIIYANPLLWILLLSAVTSVHPLTCPGDCECDVIIKEVRCVGRTMVSIPVNLSPETKSLILQWNLISFTTSTSNNTFLSLSQLTTLDLSRNYIEMIPNGLLDPLTALQELNMEHNRINRINWNAFKSLRNLKKLLLNRNQIGYIDPYSIDSGGLQMSLDILHLGNNRLQVLGDTDLHTFKSIDTLYLQNNGIHTIQPGAFNVTQVRYLNMGANRLTPAGFNLDHMMGLQELVVYSNQLKLDSTGLLQGLTSLKVLSMTSNLINTIAPGIFNGLVNLQELYLEGNNINVDCLVKELSSLGDMKALGLSSDQLTEFPYWFCDLYPNLSVIHITHSNIRIITAQLSTKCTQLKTINIKLNKISVIEPYAFSNITFKYLHLQSNLLGSLPSTVFKTDIAAGSVDLMEVYLDLNPLECDCHLKHLLQLPAVYKLSGKCSSPPELAGRIISSVPGDNFMCETTMEPTTTEQPATTQILTTEKPITTQNPTEKVITTQIQTTEKPITTQNPTTNQPSTLLDTTLQTTTEEYTTTPPSTTFQSATTIHPSISVLDTTTLSQDKHQYTTRLKSETTGLHQYTTGLKQDKTTFVSTIKSVNIVTTDSQSTAKSSILTTLVLDTTTSVIQSNISEDTSNRSAVTQSGADHLAGLSTTVTSQSNRPLATSQPNVQTVVVKETNWQWAAYLSASLFAVILLLLVVGAIICYQQRVKPSERVSPDVEHTDEPAKSNGKLPQHKLVHKHNTDIKKDENDRIYIMEDKQVKIPTADETDLNYDEHTPDLNNLQTEGPEMQEIPNGNLTVNGNHLVNGKQNGNYNTQTIINTVNGKPNNSFNAEKFQQNGNHLKTNGNHSQTANGNHVQSNVNPNVTDSQTENGSKRKQSREELKPLETMDADMEGYVLVHGITNEVTKF